MYDIVKTLLVILYILTSFVNNSEGIWCWRCSSTRERRGAGILPCSGFNYSAAYQINCLQSTLCLTRTYTIPLGDGQKVESIERDCASQRFQGYSLTNRKWLPTDTIIETAYEEGCHVAKDIGRPGPPTKYCFCSQSMCNKSSSFIEISLTLITLNLAGTLLCMWGRY